MQWLGRIAELPSFQLRMDKADKAELEKRIKALEEAKVAADAKEEEAAYEAKQASCHEMVASTGCET